MSAITDNITSEENEGGTAAKDNLEKRRKTNRAYHKKMRAMPTHLQFVAKVDNFVGRLTKMSEDAESWNKPKLLKAFAAASTKLTSLSEGLTGLGNDFLPPKKRRGRKALSIGDLVDFADKAKTKYEGILEDKELTKLTVVAINSKGGVRVTTLEGERLVIPRSHLVISASEPEDDDTSDDGPPAERMNDMF